MTTLAQPTEPAKPYRAVFIVSATLAAMNIVALLVGLHVLANNAYDEQFPDLLPQDVSQPFALYTWVQGLINGLILTAWPRSRRVGLGILCGTVGAAVLIVMVIAALLSSIGS